MRGGERGVQRGGASRQATRVTRRHTTNLLAAKAASRGQRLSSRRTAGKKEQQQKKKRRLWFNKRQEIWLRSGLRRPDASVLLLQAGAHTNTHTHIHTQAAKEAKWHQHTTKRRF